MITVSKLGGSTVSNKPVGDFITDPRDPIQTEEQKPKTLDACITNIQERHKKGGKEIIVVSALAGTTNELVAAINSKIADTLDWQTHLANIETNHHNWCEQQNVDPATIQTLLANLHQQLQGPIETSNEQYHDLIVSQGELISTKLVAAYLQNQGITSQAIDPYNLIATSGPHKDATINLETTQANAQQILGPLLAEGTIPVIPGFTGTCEQTDTPTTLGRGGTDYTAAAITHCLNGSLRICKDFMLRTADPNLFKYTSPIYEITPAQVIFLAEHGGMQAFHPRAAELVRDHDIPTQVCSTKDLSRSVTTVTKNPSQNSTRKAMGVISNPDGTCQIAISRGYHRRPPYREFAELLTFTLRQTSQIMTHRETPEGIIITATNKPENMPAEIHNQVKIHNPNNLYNLSLDYIQKDPIILR